MMSSLKTLIPPNINAVLKWRLAVTVCLIALGFIAAWGIGVLPWSSGVAMADNVDTKIQNAIQPINAKLAVNTGFLKTLVLAEYAESIRGTLRARCKATDPQEKDRLNRELERKQTEYQSVTKTATQPGRRYPEPDCEDL